MKFTPFYFFALFVGLQANAADIDTALKKQLEFFGVTKYSALPVNTSDEYQSKINLGRQLFMDVNLSGNRNISCLTCHHPMKGTSDALPLSRTVDAKGVLKRNSSSLYNAGDKFNTFMFWDGRVQYKPSTKTFITPEPALNGESAAAAHISSVMTSALSAQSIFPLVSHEEMSGQKGENEIADAKNNLEAWDLIIKRVTTENNSQRYIELFNRAFPGNSKINIGHAGEAMGTFMRVQFQSNTSPFHRYLDGDESALGEKEKRGLALFMGKGQCIACHQGSLLGNNTFFASVGVPSYGAKPFKMDLGRAEVAPNEAFKRLFFKTPSLINVALSAPYMHNGAFRTIREVLNHYNSIPQSLSGFEITEAQRKEFPVEVEILNSRNDQEFIWNSIQAGFLRMGLGLNPSELDDLEAFLTEGLTDPKWDTRKPSSKKTIQF